jgi:hypothetical protein
VSSGSTVLSGTSINEDIWTKGRAPTSTVQVDQKAAFGAGLRTAAGGYLTKKDLTSSSAQLTLSILLSVLDDMYEEGFHFSDNL